MIAIIDYGMGNLHSVNQAVQRLGYEAELTSDRRRIASADGVILPGVGAFGDAMENLRRAELIEPLVDFTRSGKPFLGICLGMQLLFSESEEHGVHPGLDVLGGKVVRLSGRQKVPHMGWNKLAYHQPDRILAGLDEGYVYFVHSFKVIPQDESDLLASTDYDEQVTAIVGRDHVYGMQFHPEKSGELGMRLLENFLQLTLR